MKTLLKNARILKMDDTPIFCGDIVIENDTITYLGPKGDEHGPFDVVRDIKGNLLMPGFKNAHTHSSMTFLRSKTDDAALQHWLFDIVFPREALLKKSDIDPLAELAFLEYLSSGITACLDQYFWPLELIKASDNTGMRVVVQTIIHDENPSKNIRETYKILNSGDYPLMSCVIGMHAEYTATKEKFDMVKAIIDEFKTPYYIHISETKKEVDECIGRHGMTPVKYLDTLGMFDYGGACYHSVWLNDEDINIFKKHNIGVVTCPGSNTKLASGIAPLDRYNKEGLVVGIGTDGPASNNCLDMFKEITLCSSLSKVSTGDPTALDAYTLLKMATVNGAKIMRLNDCDILEVGKKADIIEIDLNRPNMQPINNIVNNLVYSGSKENIKMTMINGVILYADNEFYTKTKPQELYKICQEITDRIDKELKD